MSLTSFIKNKDVKEKFAQEFPTPKFQLKGNILAEPKTNHYSLIGTAFDYLMRFYLKRINPSAITREWTAEGAVNFEYNLVKNKKILKKIEKILTTAKKSYTKYLETGKMNEEVIKSCLLLAQLDQIFHGAIDQKILVVNSKDIEDMKNLIKLVNPTEFLCKKCCMLNPTFGVASILVGGADMDLLLDDTLIDIKTTKFLKLNRNHFNQIIGYYILFLIGGIANAPKNTKVEFIGIYYSRHGLLWKIPIKEIISNCDLKKFIRWFKKRATPSLNYFKILERYTKRLKKQDLEEFVRMERFIKQFKKYAKLK